MQTRQFSKINPQILPHLARKGLSKSEVIRRKGPSHTRNTATPQGLPNKHPLTAQSSVQASNNSEGNIEKKAAQFFQTIVHEVEDYPFREDLKLAIKENLRRWGGEPTPIPEPYPVGDGLAFVDCGQIELAYTDTKGPRNTQRLAFEEFLEKADIKSHLPLQDLTKEMTRRNSFCRPKYQYTFPAGSDMEGYRIRAVPQSDSVYESPLLTLGGAVTVLAGLMGFSPSSFTKKTDEYNGFKVVLENASPSIRDRLAELIAPKTNQ